MAIQQRMRVNFEDVFPEGALMRGEVTAVAPIRHRVLVEEYLRPQTRFRHLFEPEWRADVIDALQAIADRNIRRFGLLPGEET